MEIGITRLYGQTKSASLRLYFSFRDALILYQILSWLYPALGCYLFFGRLFFFEL